MTRAILLLTFTLFLSACSDNTMNTQSSKSSPSEKEVVVQQTTTLKEAVRPTDKPAKAETKPVSGYTFYAHKCASCHGKNAEKAAFNSAQIIAGWDKEKSIAALNGYKDGTYGSSMKAIMKGQVSALSDAQIQAVSEYIATL